MSAVHPPFGYTDPAPSHEVLEQAARWFALLRSGEATAADRADWKAWLETQREHRNAWACVEAISRRFEPVQGGQDRHLAVAALRNVRRQKRRSVLGGIAVIAGGGLLGWTVLRHSPLPGMVMALNADYRTATGEIREITLADGSRIWLNTASALDADYQPALRRLRLVAGEILVQTAADPVRPFVVDTAQGRLRALGTRFTVRLAEDTTRLAVFEGAVELRTATGATKVIEAGGQVSFTRGSISGAAPAETAREAWTRGVLLAEDITLKDLVAELGRYRQGYLGVAPEVAGLRVLGGYPLRDPDRVLAMLEGVLPIRVRRTLPWWTTIEAR
ncbi:MAG: FecR domain-containing protein [Burkholderiales bacterium]|nr:FecR domain-containing protein [Burkholderiales bacterium]